MKRREIIIVISFFCVSSLIASFFVGNIKRDERSPQIKISQGPDGEGEVIVDVGMEQLKRDLGPITIEGFLGDTKIAPAEDGGLRLVTFKDTNVLKKYGFTKGDIIKSINGHRTDNLEGVISVCKEIEGELMSGENAKEVDIALVREGHAINMHFNVPAYVPEDVHYSMTLDKTVERE